MNVTPEATRLEPIVGWRFWRVDRIVTLSAGVRFRLCAAGHDGSPMVWSSREANVAQCSKRGLQEFLRPYHDETLSKMESLAIAIGRPGRKLTAMEASDNA